MKYDVRLAERFWAKVDRNGLLPEFRQDLGPCWMWTAALNGPKGYGAFSVAHGAARLAHRVAYELSIGEIPVGLTVDHLCRVRKCVNPAHLESVTMLVNLSREAAARRSGYCPSGHLFDERNSYIHNGCRYCRECNRLRARKRAA